MRSKNKDLMFDMVNYVNEFYRDNNKAPTIRRIAERFNLAKSSVQRYLVSMSESGMIEYRNGVILTDYINKFSDISNFTPLIGEIPCGNPNEEEELVEEYVNLPQALFGSGNYFILTAKGDSMVDEGIDPGDSLVIESTPEAYINDIVAALDGEGRNTLKKYGGYNDDTQKYQLYYCNENLYPGEIIEVDTLRIQGVLKYVIKKK